MFDGQGWRHHPGSQGGLISPLPHQALPQISLYSSNRFKHSPVSIDRELGKRISKSGISQEMIAVAGGIECSNHRLTELTAQLPDGHLSDLRGSPGIDNDEPLTTIHKDEAVHHPPVFRRRERIWRDDYPNMRRHLLQSVIADFGATDKSLHFASPRSQGPPMAPPVPNPVKRKKSRRFISIQANA